MGAGPGRWERGEGRWAMGTGRSVSIPRKAVQICICRGFGAGTDLLCVCSRVRVQGREGYPQIFFSVFLFFKGCSFSSAECSSDGSRVTNP